MFCWIFTPFFNQITELLQRSVNKTLLLADQTSTKLFVAINDNFMYQSKMGKEKLLQRIFRLY